MCLVGVGKVLQKLKNKIILANTIVRHTAHWYFSHTIALDMDFMSECAAFVTFAEGLKYQKHCL
jgi:hypothetical protein